MKNAEALLRCLLGPVRASVLPFSLALERTAYLLFTERRSMDDISVMKDVYALVAAQTGKTPANAARTIERTANLCWEAMDAEASMRFIGKALRGKPTPAEMLFYLAYCLHFGKPYYAVILDASDPSSIPL